jgi:hypothetical protein
MGERTQVPFVRVSGEAPYDILKNRVHVKEVIIIYNVII